MGLIITGTLRPFQGCKTYLLLRMELIFCVTATLHSGELDISSLFFGRGWREGSYSLVIAHLIATTLPGPGQRYKLYMCFCYLHAQACLGIGK